MNRVRVTAENRAGVIAEAVDIIQDLKVIISDKTHFESLLIYELIVRNGISL